MLFASAASLVNMNIRDYFLIHYSMAIKNMFMMFGKSVLGGGDPYFWMGLEGEINRPLKQNSLGLLISLSAEGCYSNEWFDCTVQLVVQWVSVKGASSFSRNSPGAI